MFAWFISIIVRRDWWMMFNFCAIAKYPKHPWWPNAFSQYESIKGGAYSPTLRLCFSHESCKISVFIFWAKWKFPVHSNISASASTKYGEDENSQQHLQLAKATFWDSIDRQAPQQCRPLKWNEIPALVDHRALIAATTLHRVSALCLSWFNFPADATHSPLPSRLSLSLLQFYW